MATTIRRTRALMTQAAVAPRVPHRQDALAITGTVPAELHGRLLRAIRHPGGGDTPALESGIAFGDGQAFWHRDRQPAPWPSAAHVRTGGSGPAERGPASVARPAGDPVTRLRHTVATYPGLDHAEHLWLGPDGLVRNAEPFALDGAPLVHAVATTARFLVVFDLPVTHRAAAALLGARFPYAWQDGRPARIGLLDRWAERPRWFAIEPCYVFNAVNAYDDRDRVIVDVIRHERAYDRGAGPLAPPTLWRWTLDLGTGTVEERQLSARPQEFPEVDPRVRGRRHRYVYGAGLTDGQTAGMLLRHDVDTGRTRVRKLGDGRVAEQPVFVPRPGTSAEGVGWVLAVVHDVAAGRADVLILNAEDLAGPPLATVHLPVRLPASLHTRWQPGG